MVEEGCLIESRSLKSEPLLVADVEEIKSFEVVFLLNPVAKIGVEAWDVVNEGAATWEPGMGCAKTLTDVLGDCELNVLPGMDVFVPNTDPKIPLPDDEDFDSPEK